MLAFKCQLLKYWDDIKTFHILIYVKSYEVNDVIPILQVRKLKHCKVTELVLQSAGMKSKKLWTFHHQSYD